MKAENIREKLEALEAENATLKVDIEELTAESEERPDFENPSSVITWYGREIVRLLSAARREKSLVRLRALNSAIDSWSKAYRLASETSELEGLKSELEELRQIVEAERRGPRIAK